MDSRYLAVRAFAESTIEDTPINWHIFKRAFDLGYKTSKDLNVKQRNRKGKFTCLICGRNSFNQKSPHKCFGGFRKRGFDWALTSELKGGNDNG